MPAVAKRLRRSAALGPGTLDQGPRSNRGTKPNSNIKREQGPLPPFFKKGFPLLQVELLDLERQGC